MNVPIIPTIYEGNINKRIAIQVSLGINVRPYSKITKANMATRVSCGSAPASPKPNNPKWFHSFPFSLTVFSFLIYF
jgi:hypothetical protein